MSVADVCSHNVETVTPEIDLAEAARRMRQSHVGDLIVVDGHGATQHPVGIITDRDILVSVTARDVDARDVRVADVMSRDLLTVREHNGIEYALREMRRLGVRRVPVTDERGMLTGVLSIDDIVDHLATQLGHIADIIRKEQQVESERRS